MTHSPHPVRALTMSHWAASALVALGVVLLSFSGPPLARSSESGVWAATLARVVRSWGGDLEVRGAARTAAARWAHVPEPLSPAASTRSFHAIPGLLRVRPECLDLPPPV